MSSSLKIGLGVVAAIVLLALLRFQPWRHAPADATVHTGPAAAGTRQALTVGFLPVTCHLTCPVTDFATHQSATGTRFDSQRFTDFPTVAAAIKSKRLQATFMIVPLAMKLRQDGVPVKICYLGHRDGSEIVVGKDDPAKSLRDLKGKTLAIPSPYSNQNLVLHELMRRQGMAEDDIKVRVLPPPQMPTALAAHAIDGYFVGEPFCGKAEMDGTGRVLYYAKDVWPHFVSCALVVHEDLIRDHPGQVRDLVSGIARSGAWADGHRLEAAKIAAPMYRQNQKLLEYVLTTPKDRVSYSMLTPTDEDLQKIADAALQQKVLQKPVQVSDLVDREFIPKDIQPADIKTAAR
jgi:NitT/TauT family transport system substrate-binding protein